LNRFRTLAGLAAVAVTAATVGVGPAATAAPEVSKPLASGLSGALGLEVGPEGVYVTQDMGNSGLVRKLTGKGELRTVARAAGAVGVAARNGRVAFTMTKYDRNGTVQKAQLRVRTQDGDVRIVKDLLAYERRNNPDAGVTYNFLGPDSCDVPDFAAPYQGIVDSHPYALAHAPRGGWYVADAAGNDILLVKPNGRTKVVAVLPRQVTRISAEFAEANGIPRCAVGRRAAFEAVPTDVEVAKNGTLFVSLLPGGPEDPSAGARGVVVRVNPKKGRVSTVAKGLSSATGLAIGKRGKLYVTELFGNEVSVVNARSGKVRRLVQLEMPTTVEYWKGKLYVTHGVLGPDGKLVVIRL
jgi:hypothetical protein